MPKISDIISAIEAEAPLSLQEGWDNSGLQAGHAEAECTGVMLAVDPTEWAIDEAVRSGCNLLVTHHPLLFHAPKQFVGATAVQRVVERALRDGVAVYSAHTSMDNAPRGLNRRAAEMLGLVDIEPLIPSPVMAGAGSGAVGRLSEPVAIEDFVAMVKSAFGSPVVRLSRARGRKPGEPICRVALCTGSGSSMLHEAEAAGADLFLTSDTRYHDFLDHGSGRMLIADIGHHESEMHARDIFYRIITEKFPNFAVSFAHTDANPILYA